MGIDTGAAIIVGLKYEELMQHISEEQFNAFWWVGVLKSLSPWYDSYACDQAYGVPVYVTWEGNIKEIDLDDFTTKVEDARKKFHSLVGVNGKILFGADVS